MVNPLQWKHISTNSTAVLATRQAVLGAICINTPGASANTVTVYNGTVATGDKIATIDTAQTTHTPTFLLYNVALSQGLTIVVATGTAADITVTYEGTV